MQLLLLLLLFLQGLALTLGFESAWCHGICTRSDM
jgi:hypothetical protein